MGEPRKPFLTRVVIQNYKSIAQCDVRLGPLMFLVGPNGAGKSNFLDALQFVSDALNGSLVSAVQQRGGIKSVVGRDTPLLPLRVRLEFALPPEGMDGASGHGHYELEVQAVGNDSFALIGERCAITSPDNTARSFDHDAGGAIAYKGFERGEVRQYLNHAPGVSSLFLPVAAFDGAMRPALAHLRGIATYHIEPDALRGLEAPEPLVPLARDGRNIASVLRRLEANQEDLEWLETYLQLVDTRIQHVSVEPLADRLGIEFTQASDEAASMKFWASNMSDGTLHALGVLAALRQHALGTVSVVGIEEPESGLHPGASTVLFLALQDASAHVQVIVTTHSPDILDNVAADSILAVRAQHGQTRIGPLNAIDRSVLQDGLFSVGELLRLNELYPTPVAPQLDSA